MATKLKKSSFHEIFGIFPRPIDFKSYYQRVEGILVNIVPFMYTYYNKLQVRVHFVGYPSPT